MRHRPGFCSLARLACGCYALSLALYLFDAFIRAGTQLAPVASISDVDSERWQHDRDPEVNDLVVKELRARRLKRICKQLPEDSHEYREAKVMYEEAKDELRLEQSLAGKKMTR